jgi:inner membrane protein
LPTIFTHAATGLSGGKLFFLKKEPKKFWFFSILLPVLPDADSITFAFNIPYWHDFGHRGFFHSIFFALLLVLFVMLIFFREDKIFSKSWILKLFFFFVITSSHGILDAFTNGGLGIALFAPFDNTRYFFPYQPIPVSPIGIGSFFSSWGVAVLFSEIVCLWIPLFLLIYMQRIFFRLRQKSSEKRKNRL